LTWRKSTVPLPAPSAALVVAVRSLLVPADAPPLHPDITATTPATAGVKRNSLSSVRMSLSDRVVRRREGPDARGVGNVETDRKKSSTWMTFVRGGGSIAASR
jgi:hypothetical protein